MLINLTIKSGISLIFGVLRYSGELNVNSDAMSISEFHRKHRSTLRGQHAMLHRTVSLRLDFYQKLLELQALWQRELGERLTLAETVAYVIQIVYEAVMEQKIKKKRV